MGLDRGLARFSGTIFPWAETSPLCVEGVAVEGRESDLVDSRFDPLRFRPVGHRHHPLQLLGVHAYPLHLHPRDDDEAFYLRARRYAESKRGARRTYEVASPF